MIKVLLLRSSGGFLGAEKVLLELCLELPALGVEPIVGIPVDGAERPELIERCQALGIRTELFPFSHPLSLSGMRAIKRFVQRERIDVIHTHGYREDIYALLMREYRRVVATNHLWKRTTRKLAIYAAIDAFAMRFFPAIVAVSQPIFDEMARIGLPRKKLSLIENGITLADYDPRFSQREAVRAELGLADTDFVFGMVSSLSEEKGHRYALRALAGIHQQGYPAKLVIIGDGADEAALRALTRELNIEAHVVFAGRRRDIPLALQAFTVFLMPSLIEGLPMALLEAMAAGLPVIATGVGDIPKLVSDEVGTLVPPANEAALMTAMKNVIEHRASLIERGARARGLVESRFSSRQMAAKYASIYNSVVKEK